MQLYQDIISLFDLTESDLSSRKTLMSKREEFLLRFQLTNTVTIDINGETLDRNAVIQLFDTFSENIDHYRKVEQMDGLNHFLITGDFRLLNFKSVEKLTPEFIEWVKPFINQAYYSAAVIHIENDSDLDVLEYKNIKNDLADLKDFFGHYYFEEAQQEIDEKWLNTVSYLKERHLKGKHPLKRLFLKAFPNVKKVTNLRRARLLTLFTFPYNKGRIVFDTFLTDMVNYSINAVNGNMNTYEIPVIKYLWRIVKYLEKESSIKVVGFTEIRKGLEEIVWRSQNITSRNKTILLIILLYFGYIFSQNLGCKGRRTTTSKITISKHHYNAITNTFQVNINKVSQRGISKSGDELIKYGMGIFKKYFPDVDNFTFIGRLKSSDKDLVIRRKLVKDSIGYQVFPTREDSILLSQFREVNYDFDQEALWMEITSRVPRKIRNNQGENITVGYLLEIAQFLVTNKDSLDTPGHYLKSEKAPENDKLGMLNDFFYLKDKEINIHQPLTLALPTEEASYFFKEQDSLTLTLENGMDLETFFIIGSSEGKERMVYTVDRKTYKIIEISGSRWKPRLGHWKNTAKRVKR